MTKLQEYLTRNGVRQSAFAARVGATQATISKLAGGTARPSLELAVTIDRETAGEVPCDSWLARYVPAADPSRDVA